MTTELHAVLGEVLSKSSREERRPTPTKEAGEEKKEILLCLGLPGPVRSKIERKRRRGKEVPHDIIAGANVFQ